jgi:hypothetical protein
MSLPCCPKISAGFGRNLSLIDAALCYALAKGPWCVVGRQSGGPLGRVVVSCPVPAVTCRRASRTTRPCSSQPPD